MSSLSKIRNAQNLTETEQKIACYIEKNYTSIFSDTTKTLADKTATSPAAIIRFSKKLGYQGFSQFKMDLALEAALVPSKTDFYSNIKKEDSFHTIIQKAKLSNTLSLEQTYDLINESILIDASIQLKKANTIYLFGIGASAICCMDFAQKLTRIGRKVIFYQDFHTQLPASYYISKNDVALAISYSGNTKEILVAMKHAKENGASTISITQMNKSPLLKNSDLLLYVPTEEKNLRLGAVNSRNASLILTDLLYFGIICEDLDLYKSYIASTRALTNQIRLH